tara:strand:- start:314 stop:469 length:156 start_codon:yes stop_codon:yes gene_type:complete
MNKTIRGRNGNTIEVVVRKNLKNKKKEAKPKVSWASLGSPPEPPEGEHRET